MARSVYFSLHYQQDIWRVNQIRNVPSITSVAAAGFRDASLWEDAERKGDTAIKRLIVGALNGTSVTVVCIGYRTAGRQYINYAIEESAKRGNGILGVQIHHLQDQNQQADPEGDIPYKLKLGGRRVYRYTNVDDLARWIETAAPYV